MKLIHFHASSIYLLRIYCFPGTATDTGHMALNNVIYGAYILMGERETDQINKEKFWINIVSAYDGNI